MSVNASYEISTAAGAWNAPSRSLRLEKPRESGGLGGERDGEQAPFDRRGARPTRRAAFQFGTAPDVSPWHGPVLSAPFAAQVIAQALSTKAPGAASAYPQRAARLAPALLLDRDA